MTTQARADDEWLDEIFDIDTVHDLELPHWWVKETKAKLKAHFAAKQELAELKARRDELERCVEQTEMKRMDNGYAVPYRFIEDRKRELDAQIARLTTEKDKQTEEA